MKRQIPAEKFLPWPDDMEEALAAQQQRLQEIARRRNRPELRTMRRTRVIRWAIRIVVIAITFWLLCETAIAQIQP
jgi:hypothetical protein